MKPSAVWSCLGHGFSNTGESTHGGGDAGGGVWLGGKGGQRGSQQRAASEHVETLKRWATAL